MTKVGYARVSSTGQSLEVQLQKLKEIGCDRIYQEKHSGVTAARPQFQECMNYLREGDTLFITRLDRLARSVFHLAELSRRFEQENIDLVVLDQNIDTSTTTGRLMFNLLACIAEFENGLRAERQKEGIDRAKKNKVKFGRPSKLTEEIRKKIIQCRQEGIPMSKIMHEFNVGQSTIYRVLKGFDS